MARARLDLWPLSRVFHRLVLSPSSLMSSAAEMPAAASAPRKRKRVRNQKTDRKKVKLDDDADNAQPAEQQQQHADDDMDLGEAVAHDVKVKTEPIDDDADADAEPGAVAVDESAPASSSAVGDQPAAADKAQGGGYLSQETLSYYRQLAEVLDKDEFENEEGPSLHSAQQSAACRTARQTRAREMCCVRKQGVECDSHAPATPLALPLALTRQVSFPSERRRRVVRQGCRQGSRDDSSRRGRRHGGRGRCADQCQGELRATATVLAC